LSSSSSNKKNDIVTSFIPSLVLAGFTQTEAEEIAQKTTIQEKQQILKEIDKPNVPIKEIAGVGAAAEPKSDGFINALTLAGFSAAISRGIVEALSDDEQVIQLLLAAKIPLKFMTQQDSKVDDKICLPKQGEVWAKDDPNRPRIPLSLHPNCRCFWQDPISRRNLGQF